MPGMIRCPPHARRATIGMAVLLIVAAVPAPAAGRFEVRATLTSATEAQRSASYTLRARLADPTAPPLVQLGSRHAVSAKLVESPLVCYGDTIFRDGFDGL